MTMLHVIRHGKAMAGAERYDELHPLGEAQSRLLGRRLREERIHFDAVYSGPLVRQLDTLRHMRTAAEEVGTAWPEPIILPELAEAPLEALAKHCMTERLATDGELQALIVRLAQEGKTDPSDAFEALLRYVVRVWLDGEMPVPGIETAPDFGRRVRAALATILRRHSRASHIAVVTSNGVIGWLKGHAENESDPERRCFAHRVYNASVSHFSVAPGKLDLLAWNLIEHLSERRLQTLL